MRKRLLIGIEEGMLRYGAAVTVDGVHLKLQGKHFYDFTVHLRKSRIKDHSKMCASTFELRRCFQ